MSFDVTTLALAKSYTNQHGGSGGGWPSDLPKPSVGGYGYTEQGNQTVITWDGNTEGKHMVIPMSPGIDYEFYKIAELTPTTDEVIGGVIYTKAGDNGTFRTEITADSITTMSEHLYRINGYAQNMVIVALEYSEIGGVTFERGMYFNKIGSGDLAKYIKYIDYGTPDTVHKIDEKYLPEGYPTKSVQTITLMEEQEVAFTSNKGVYVAEVQNAFEIVAGQTYTVNWDGTEYECVAFASDEVGGIVLGNLSVAGLGDDTGEPFVYVHIIKGSFGEFVTLNTSASHTISIKRIEEIVTPMAEEFLLAGVGTTALITYVSSTNTHSSDLTYDELHEILLDHKQVVFWEPEENRCSYLTRWEKNEDGRIRLAFGGGKYSVLLNTDGTFRPIFT